jgi:hypothetical protein
MEPEIEIDNFDTEGSKRRRKTTTVSLGGFAGYFEMSNVGKLALFNPPDLGQAVNSEQPLQSEKNPGNFIGSRLRIPRLENVVASAGSVYPLFPIQC